jgi:hypothetical protein
MMKKFLIAQIFIFSLVFAGIAQAQSQQPVKYWIFFKDKGKYKPDIVITPGSDAYNAGLALLTERAIKRRLKVLPEDKLIDYADLPLNESYVNEIKSAGIEIIAKSRWLNGVSAYLSKKQLEELNDMDFISGYKVIKMLQKQELKSGGEGYLEAEGYYNNFMFAKAESLDTKGNKLDYGPSLEQMEVVNVPRVHNLGVTGKGILIASFDDGFGWKEHEALKNLHVIGEYDFINKDKNTYPESYQKHPDNPSQGSHGTATVSTMSGYAPGKLISPAFESELLLAKTEYVSSETPMEEDFWLEAAEWSEAQGVDIITSSLIYKDYYDDLEHPNSYTYKDFDGNTAITSIAGDRCAYLGIAVFNSIGNYYQTAIPSLGSSADGDSVIAVGAIDLDGEAATFTSNGPTSDGQTKPDLVAPGVNVYAATIKSQSGDDSTYEYTSGTSFSCPITAGIGALILSAHPELTPMQLRDALRNTASNNRTPNNILGWGNVNAYDALLYFGPAWSNSPEILNTESGGIEVSIYLASKDLIDQNSVKVFYSTGDGEFREASMQLREPLNDGNNSGRYSASLEVAPGTPIKLYFYAKDFSGKETTYPKKAPEEWIVK